MQFHKYHMVDVSPWPLCGALSAYLLTNGAVMYFNFVKEGWFLLNLGFILVLATMYLWWRDVVRESTLEGRLF